MLLPKSREARALQFALLYVIGLMMSAALTDSAQAAQEAADSAQAASGLQGSIQGQGKAGHVPDAQRTIALKMPAFRRCFERMHASGRVSLTMTIVRDGAVSWAKVEGPVPRIVARCIESQALETIFSQPQGGDTARLQVPVSFIRQ